MSRPALFVLSLCTAFALAAASPGADAQSRRRPGIRVQFATIDGGGGLDGSAFLVVNGGAVTFDSGDRRCGGGHVVDVVARHHRAHVKRLHFRLHLRGTGELTVRDSGCPSAEIDAEMDGVGDMSGGEGSVTITEADLRPGGTVIGSFSWTVIQNGRPLPMRGRFHIPL